MSKWVGEWLGVTSVGDRRETGEGDRRVTGEGKRKAIE